MESKMAPTNRILATLLLMVMVLLPSISALPRDAELSIDFVYPHPSGNITNIYENNTYINQTVNATVNTTQFDSNNPISIKSSWLQSMIEYFAPAPDLSNYYNKSTSDNRFCFANGTNTNGEICSTNSTYPIIYNMPKSNEVYIGDRNFALNITVPSNVYYIELSNSFLICERDSYGFVGNDCIFEYINFDDLGDNEFNTASIQFYDILGNPLYLDKTLTYYFYPDIQSLADATEEHNVKSTWLEDIKDWVNYIFFNSEGLSINNRSMGINSPHGNEIIDGKMFFSEMYGSKFIRYNNPENLSDTDIITISGYSGFPSMYFNEDDGYIYTYAVNNKTIIRINITSLSYDILGTIPVPTTSLNQAMTVNGGYVYIGYTNSVYKFNLTTNSYESNISLGIGGGLVHSIKPSPDGQYIIATSLGQDYFIRINKTDDTVSLLDISQYVTTPTDDFQAYEDYAYISGETKESFIKINYKTMNIVKNVSGVASWFVIMDEDKKNIYTGALDGTMLRYRIEDGLSIQYELPKKTYNEGYFINEKLYLTTYTNDATIEEISLINPIIINDGQTTTFNSTQFETGEPATIKTSWLTNFIESISKWANYWTKTELSEQPFTQQGRLSLPQLASATYLIEEIPGWAFSGQTNSIKAVSAWLVPIYVSRGVSYRGFRYDIYSTTGKTADSYRVGIYDVDYSTGLPKNLVWDSGKQTFETTTGAKQVIGLNIVLTEGWYYIVGTKNGNINLYGSSPAQQRPPLGGFGTSTTKQILTSTTADWTNGFPNPWVNNGFSHMNTDGYEASFFKLYRNSEA